MPASTIIVHHKDGSPARDTRVVLGFAMGMSETVYTDRNGLAVVEHASRGEATVYIKGSKQGKFQAPGKFAVTLR